MTSRARERTCRTRATARTSVGKVLFPDKASRGQDHRHLRVVEPRVVGRHGGVRRDVVVEHGIGNDPHRAREAGHMRCSRSCATPAETAMTSSAEGRSR